MPRDGHREGKAVGLEGKLEVGGWEPGPFGVLEARIAVGGLERLEQSLKVGLLALDDRFHVARARMVLGMVRGCDQREDAGVSYQAGLYGRPRHDQTRREHVDSCWDRCRDLGAGTGSLDEDPSFQVCLRGLRR